MSNKIASPSKQRGNFSQLHLGPEMCQSFLYRYFSSKEFVFPELDQDNVNSKILSLRKLANGFEKEIADFKSWILNSYPMSSYFKHIILDDKSTRIICPFNSLSKNFHRQEKNIYIGQTHSFMKHGYGFEIKVWCRESDQESEIVQFQAYEGFYVNDIKHGRGKYFSNTVKTPKPVFYYGRFVNGQSFEENIALMVWASNDFYIGRVKPSFTKQGLGALFITPKHKSFHSQIPFKIDIKPDPYFYDKVIVCDWQSNNNKSQSHSHSTSTFYNLLSQTKIISHSQHYFGQAHVYYSTKKNTHICIKQGNGRLKYLSGDMYQGKFTFDKISGYGKYLWANENYYIGQFADGQKQGTGFWKDATTHDEYEGQYQNNKRNGKGEYRWGNGNIYNGQFKNDLREGFGKIIWATGQVYEGIWKDGLQNGVGALYLLNGSNQVFVRESEFVNGIEMEKGQNFRPMPNVPDSKRHSNFSNKSKKHSHLSSSRQKSSSFQNQFRQHKKASSLPKINQKTALKFTKQTHLKTQSYQFIEQPMPKKIHKFSSILEKRIQQRSLDYNQTQKLPYHQSLSKPNSKTQKIQRYRISSFFSGSLPKYRKKKIFCVDVTVEDESVKGTDLAQGQEKQSGENVSEEKKLGEGIKKMNEILGESLMVPIKWRNIKRKGQNFIFQRKQKGQRVQTNDKYFS